MPFWRKLIVVLILFWCCGMQAQAATDAGTTIVNQATLTYTDKATGQLVELKSNASTILVAPLYQFELLSPNTLLVDAGQTVSFSHTLQNIGNIEDRYALSVENLLADNGDLINLLLYIDKNDNGIVDSDESVVDDDIALVAGESVSLVIVGLLPEELDGNNEVEVAIHAQSLESDLPIQTNTDLVSIRPYARIEAELQSSVACDIASRGGDKIDLQLTAINRTNTLPIEKPIFIDGEQRSGVLLEVDLPDGLQLTAEQFLDIAAYQSIAVVQSAGSGNQWMRYDQWTGLVSIDRFGLLVPKDAFSIDELVQAVLPIEVEADAAGGKVFVSGGIDFNGDAEREVEFVPGCVNIIQLGQASVSAIRFIEPNFGLQKLSQVPRFEADEDFIDAPLYRLNGNDTNVVDHYQLSINGVYVELNTTVSSQQILKGQAGARFVIVSVESSLTGDRTELLLRETQPDSNLYRSVKPILLSSELAADGAYCPGGLGALLIEPDFDSGDDVCTLLSEADDTLTVRFVNELTGNVISDTAVVDPVSRVFDSTSLEGVEGASVSVVIGTQVQNHPISGEPLVFVTDTDGRYSLPRLLAEQNYALLVEPPSSHVFPSTVDPEQFSAFEVSGVSYGANGFALSGEGSFSVTEGEAAPVIDIPLDPSNRDALLLVEKSVASSSVDVGEAIAYSISVTNRSSGPLDNVSVMDYPAFGFRFVSGSARFNGEPIANPKRLTLPARSIDAESSENDIVSGLQFELPRVDAESESVLSYRMRATAGATDGAGVNRATGNATTLSGLVLATPTSLAKVSVERKGVFSDKAILFGKVFVDSSCDGIQNRGEWPIGGVRLYLQDGTFVVTDEDGQYSVYGLDPGLHVIKLDTLSLPDGLVLKPIDTRQAADPESRFVDLSAGDFHRADFASYCPTHNADAVFEDLKRRNKDLRDAWLLNEASQYDPDASAPSLDARKRADVDGDLSQSMLGFPRSSNEGRQNQINADVGSPTTAKGVDAANAPKPNTGEEEQGTVLRARSTAREQMGDPQELVKTITEEQAQGGTWLWPKDDLSWDGRFMAVIKSGLDPQLYVNGQAVSRTQIGEQIINRRAKAQLVAWYGVKLVPGLNRVEIKAKDSFGNERLLAEGAFRRPSAGVRLLLRTKQDTLEADGGRSSLPIDIVITDAHNNPANGVYFVTLRSSAGEFEEEDLQLREPGMQVRVENGRGRVHLRSTELTGAVRVQARTGALDASLNVVQIAAARPLIGAGLIDIGGQWNRVRSGSDTRANLEDGFQSDGRIAMFLKGRVKNDMHLSMSYDSEKKKSVSVLRDINPNDYYATYGDSSSRGFEAQSRSKLYLKLEKDRNSVMWGDYLTDNNTQHDDLGRVQRTLTGLNGVLDNGTTRLQVFAANENAIQTSEEIRGNGTAMLYQIEQVPIAINSEVVERIVRDRNNPGLIIESETLQRYVDYSINFESGLLRFADVVPSVDENLNPVFIRINYAMDNGGEEHLVSGIRMLHTITPQLQVAASLTDDQNPISGYTLSSITAIAHAGVNTKLSMSSAFQVHRDQRNDANAHRINVEHNWQGKRDFRTVMTWARSSLFFDNPAAGVSQGREEWRVEHIQPVANTVKAVANASHSQSIADGSSNTNAGVTFEKSFSSWSARAGLRHIQNEDTSSSFRFNTFLFGAEKRFTLAQSRRGSIGIEYEQDTANNQRYRLGLSSRVQLHDHVNGYFRYELDRGLSFQSYSIDENINRQFVAGVESDIFPSTKVYSEYRLKGNYGGQSMETASGIRGRYELKPNLSITPAIEVINVMEGTGSEDSVAVSMGVIDKRNVNRKLSAQAEVRETKSNRYFGFRGTVAQRLSVDWTGLLREEFTRQTPDIGQLTSRHRLSLGLARRPKRNNVQHSLFMFNWKEDYGPQDGQDRTSYLLSTHQNRQIADNAVLSGRFGARWTNTRFETGAVHSQAIMSDLRATFDIHRRWELDMRGGWLGTNGIREGKYSFGVGVHWIADRNMRLGLNYNVIGFREEDLDEQGYNKQGIRLGLQVKFDEDWFKWLE